MSAAFELKAIIVIMVSGIVTEIVKRYCWPKFWQTKIGHEILKQVSMLVGAVIFGFWGQDEHAIPVGIGLGAIPRMLVEGVKATRVMRQKRRNLSRRSKVKEGMG